MPPPPRRRSASLLKAQEDIDAVRGERLGRLVARTLTRHGTVLEHLLASAGCCARLGLDVHTGRMLDVAEALQHVDLGSRDEVYHTLPDAARASPRRLSRSSTAPSTRSGDRLRRRIGASAHRAPGGRASDRRRACARRTRAADDDARRRTGRRRSRGVRTWSDADAIADKDFAELTADEMASPAPRLPASTGIPANAGRGGGFPARRAHRPAARAGAQPSHRRRDRDAAAPAPAHKPRPIVLLCDVSGSMERYSRMLLHFAHALARRHRARRGVSLLDASDAHHHRAAHAAAGRGDRRRVAVGARTGRAARASARRCARFTSAGDAACCTAARWSC